MDDNIQLSVGRSAAWCDRTSYAGLVAATAMLALAFTGCSGGLDSGTGGTGKTATVPPPAPVSQSTGTIVVQVKDELGAPVAGAKAVLWGGKTVQSTTDANGRIEVSDFPNSSTVAVTVYGPDSYGYGPDKAVVVGGVLQFDITTFPWAPPTGGVVGVTFPQGVQADGMALEFTLKFAASPLVPKIFWPAGLTVLSPSSCTPDPGNDAPRFQPDCIGDVLDFDAPYTADGGGSALETVAIPGAMRSPLAVALLLDQSARVIVSDPAHSRLRGVRAFLTQLGTQDSVALAAYAGAGNDAQGPALVPLSPVTIFPLDDPRFESDARVHLSTLDTLAAMAGGASPLHAALDDLIDFVATHAPADARRTIVVLTDGDDDFCGDAMQCLADVQALVQKAKSSSVSITTIGLAGAVGRLNQVALGTLARGTDGIAFQTTDPKQLVAIFHSLPALLSGSGTTFAATYRIESSVAGALAPGRTVLGKVRLLNCVFDCDYAETDIPFAFQLP